MRKYSIITFCFLWLALVAMSCQSNETIESEAPQPKGKSFSARYIIPLTTGREGTGEATIIDPENAKTTNVAELKPVMAEVVEAALSGKIPSYPDEGSTDSQNDPRTFLRRHYDRLASGGRPVRDGELLVSLELEYDGMAFDGYSKMTFKHMDLTWVDSDDILPDRNMARVFAKDLKGFKVKKGNSELSLPEYLDARQYEHYVIRVYAPQDTFGLRTHADARSVQQKLDQGQITDLNPN